MKCARRISFSLIAAAMLVGCAPDGQTSFRDTAAPMGATTRFDAVSFAGPWVLVASFAPRKTAPVVVNLAPEVAHLRVTSDEVPEIAGLYREGIPGELIPVSGASEPLIVMWVDDEFRTAAIGTASGSFGAVLNRDPEITKDKAIAAREIFEFYGWNVSRLRRTGP